MKHTTRALLTLLAAVFVSPQIALSNETAEAAKKILERNCVSCHGLQQKYPGVDVRDFATLILEGDEWIEPGDPDSSRLYEQVANDYMPIGNNPKLTDEEKETLRQWIQDGPVAFEKGEIARERVSEADVQQAILDYFLEDLDLLESDVRHQRFFTFTNLHNNRAISNGDLQLYKAAFSKVLNSLSWESEIVAPRPVDQHETVFVVDLRDLDWTEQDHWNKLLAEYPYAIDYQDDRVLARVSKNIERNAKNPVQNLYIRADWFVNNATRPPLYHTLLELPTTTDELEQKLDVRVIDDFQNGRRLIRGGVLKSGVSRQNRILDRHPAITGYYWKSYDFGSQVGTGDVRSHPLGPVFDDHPFQDEAFVHDGGEIIFSLPNGLQGYFLTNAEGTRIDIGPSNIVFDPGSTSGTADIVNGLSCINCHKDGMRAFEDVVLEDHVTGTEASEKVRSLFPTNDRMKAWLEKDNDRFLEALAKSVKGFIPSDRDYLKGMPNEPVGAFARWYQAAVDRQTVEADLGRELTPGDIEDLRDIGIIIPTSRDSWDDIGNGGNSGFQKACVELRIGGGFTFTFPDEE